MLSSRLRVIVGTLAFIWLGTLKTLLVSLPAPWQHDQAGPPAQYASHFLMSHQLQSFVLEQPRTVGNAGRDPYYTNHGNGDIRRNPGLSPAPVLEDRNWVLLAPDFDPTTHTLAMIPGTAGEASENGAATSSSTASSMLPGLFWQQRLWLLGARLTTSYDDTDDTVFLTLFGMPGDFHNRTKGGRIRCPSNKVWYNGHNGTILSYPETRRRVHLYASLPDDPKRLLPLEFIPSVSGDFNQNNNTLIWHGELPGLVLPSMQRTITSIRKEKVRGRKQVSTSSRMALRVTIHASLMVDDTFDPSPTPIMAVDIPLSTGVVGQAGPQVVAAAGRNADSHSAGSDDGGVTLCVAIYGDNTTDFLPEFILHHANLGFGPIVVGMVDATIGSEKFRNAQSSLEDFVEQGIVELAAMGLPSPLQPMLKCEVNVGKQHFYNACLYHAKGRTPYMGIWDIDEFWVPPKPLTSPPPPPPTAVANATSINEDAVHTQSMDLWRHSNYSTSMTVGQAMSAIQDYQDSAGCGESWCYHAFLSWPVWLRRRRRRQNNMEQLHYSKAEAAIEWDNEQLPSRTGKVLEDFDLRNTAVDWEWSKSITRTKYAYMGGLHQTGSCRFHNKHKNPKFVSRNDVAWYNKPYKHIISNNRNNNTKQAHQQKQQKCRNLMLEGFGMIHHFYSLNRVRSIERLNFGKSCMGEGVSKDDDGSSSSSDDDKYDDDDESEDDDDDSSRADNEGGGCVVDEYVERFGPTVHKQLKARQKNRLLSLRNTGAAEDY